MHLPGDLLDRVRGALVVAALTSCGHEVSGPAPSPSAVVASPVAASAVVATERVSVDPVSYASTDEADRLARLDAEDAAGVEARRARLQRLAAQHREELPALGNLGTGTGAGPGMRYAACGRG
jgi:hypothetical protein